jgi:cysteinyl-tRNA synthetase
MIRVHDTLSSATVELVPREPGKVSIYVCGPTVYEVPHVGHGRAAVVFDVIRRYLEWRGLDVTFVSNVTDVEDKIIARAASERTSESEVAQRYEAAYWEELDRVGVRRPDQLPRATGYIAPMIELIRELIDNGRAYVVEGSGVYYDVSAYEGYGELSGRHLDDLLESAGARIEVDDEKRNPVDFALWKAAKPGEPAWDSPWGRGRPGWHIECSAMSLDLLGDGFDLHGGGDDLIFPHHENERAQAEGSGHPFARYWIHNGMVMVGNEKMAKSLGNFTTLHDALDAHGGRAFRLAVLQAQYRSQMELSDGELTAAGAAVKRLDSLVRRAADANVEPEAPDESVLDAFRAAMDNDFGTPAALGVVFETVRRANSAIDAELPEAGALVAAVIEATGALGLDIPVKWGGASVETPPEITELAQEREAARGARDFATADRIRDDLQTRGWLVEDTASGPVLRRVERR